MDCDGGIPQNDDRGRPRHRHADLGRGRPGHQDAAPLLRRPGRRTLQADHPRVRRCRGLDRRRGHRAVPGRDPLRPPRSTWSRGPPRHSTPSGAGPGTTLGRWPAPSPAAAAAVPESRRRALRTRRRRARDRYALWNYAEQLIMPSNDETPCRIRVRGWATRHNQRPPEARSLSVRGLCGGRLRGAQEGAIAASNPRGRAPPVPCRRVARRSR